MFVCNEAHRFILAEQVKKIKGIDAKILLEPKTNNTAPAAALAALEILTLKQDALLLVLPADHYIADTKKFNLAISAATIAAENDKLVTFGVVPLQAETGYGYIKYNSDDKKTYKKVKTFTEKPTLDLANEFVDSGDYVWNAGIFIWNVKSVINALAANAPELYEKFESGKEHFNTETEIPFINSESESTDVRFARPYSRCSEAITSPPKLLARN